MTILQPDEDWFLGNLAKKPQNSGMGVMVGVRSEPQRSGTGMTSVERKEAWMNDSLHI